MYWLLSSLYICSVSLVRWYIFLYGIHKMKLVSGIALDHNQDQNYQGDFGIHPARCIPSVT